MPNQDDPGRRRFGWFRRVAIVIGAVAVGVQFVTYGWHHSNPPVVQDAPWPDAASRDVARESCYSCHSNETDWPAYSYVAPMSWLVRSDVERGREEFNFSDWERFADDVDDAIEVIESGEMPPGRYTFVHRGATLSDVEREVLLNALMQMSVDDHEDEREDDE